MIRWQSHWHVVRQSWTFFQNDFAGRIANRVMQVGPRPAGKRRLVHQRRLVHRRIRHQRDAAAWPGGLAPGDPARPVVRHLYRPSTLLRAPRPRQIPPGVGAAFQPHRAGGGQLHQYPHGQAVRPRAGRGRVRGGCHGRAYGCAPAAIAAGDALGADAADDQCLHGGGDGRAERLVVDPRLRRRRHVWRWRCHWPGRWPTSPVGCPTASPRSSKTWGSCRTRCAPSPFRCSGRMRRAPVLW